MIDLTPPLQNHTCAHARKQNNHLEVQCDFYKHEINSMCTQYVAQLVAAVQGKLGDQRSDLMKTVGQINAECPLKGVIEQIICTQD